MEYLLLAIGLLVIAIVVLVLWYFVIRKRCRIDPWM
jgi:high-affinity Fe2+/Pb2+ permease